VGKTLYILPTPIFTTIFRAQSRSTHLFLQLYVFPHHPPLFFFELFFGI